MRKPGPRLAEEVEPGDDSQLDEHGQQDGQADEIEPAKLAQGERRQRGEPHSQWHRQAECIERMIGRTVQFVENPLAEAGCDQGQERREAKVDHGSVVLPGRVVHDAVDQARRSITATQNCEADGSGSIGIGPDSAKTTPWWRYHWAVS